MIAGFDQHEMNHMTVAIEREMSPRRGKRHREADTCFLGGVRTSNDDLDALARFGLAKNYQVIQPIYDNDAVGAPVNFNCVVTDGLTKSFALTDGRIWKRDRDTSAVLLFPTIGTVVRLNLKGRLVVRPMTRSYHDHGYELAREAVLTGAALRPGGMPIVSTIGTMVVVLDAGTMKAASAAAE